MWWHHSGDIGWLHNNMWGVLSATDQPALVQMYYLIKS